MRLKGLLNPGFNVGSGSNNMKCMCHKGWTILNKLLTHAVTAYNKLVFVSILCWCKMLLVSFKNFLEIFNNDAQLFWECATVLDIDYYTVLFLAQ